MGQIAQRPPLGRFWSGALRTYDSQVVADAVTTRGLVGIGQAAFISVAIPTCNRPGDVERCLASLARVQYPRWELILVDQSDGDETRSLATSWRQLIPNITYLRLKEKNASAARNVAIEHATGDVLAFIDDDCSVEPDWLDRVNRAFIEEPGAQLIFGSVVAAQHDSSAFFVLEAAMRDKAPLRGAADALRVRGMGASMYLRLDSTIPRAFDLLLGPGARFRGAQDQDYAHRLLAEGGTIVQTPRIVVAHHGARPFDGGAASTKLRDYFYGAGACHVKLLRCGDWIMVAVILRWLTLHISEIRPHHALVGEPTHVGRVLSYIRGLRAGFTAPVDRRNRVFRASISTHVDPGVSR
jgi:glycosyltransferase involved in cell wall biosynthesis